MPGNAKDKPHLTQQEEIAEKKAEYLRYFTELPIQRAAADWIGRNEDTILNWKKSDNSFAEAVSRAKSDWAKKNHRKMRPDNLMAHLYDETKPPKQELDITLPTSITITHVHPSDHDQPDQKAG